IDAAIRKEPGVLVLYAVSEKGNPTHVKVFEIYRDRSAYEAHLGSDHFKKYKTTVEKMVKSLKLIQATPIMLGAQSKREEGIYYEEFIRVSRGAGSGDRDW